MSRSLDSSVVTQIQSEGIRLAYLAEFSFSSAVYLTNHSKNLAFNSQTYVADGQLHIEDSREETGKIEYSNMTVFLKNISDAMRTNLKAEDYVGTEVTITLGFLDATELITASYEIFKGTIGSAAMVEKAGQVLASIELVSHWKDWESTKGRTFTVESQNAVFASDRGLDYAHRTRENLEWGQP